MVVRYVRSHDQHLAPLRFLYMDYKPQTYFAEPIEMYRRVAFVAVLPLLASSTDKRAAIGVGFAILSSAG